MEVEKVVYKEEPKGTLEKAVLVVQVCVCVCVCLWPLHQLDTDHSCHLMHAPTRIAFVHACFAACNKMHTMRQLDNNHFE